MVLTDDLRLGLKEALEAFYWCADQTDGAIKANNKEK